MPIPPPPVPQRLREMLKDYPDLIERLQADLTYVANAKRRGYTSLRTCHLDA